MLSRVLGVATAMLVMSLAAVPAQAQNLEAGKSPSQIFSGSCAACHKSPRGLLKSVPPGSLPGFLRQHYTTGPDMASLLAAYVISNGAADPRGGGGLTRQGQELVAPRRPAEARPDGRPGAPAAAAAPAPAPAESPGFFGFGRRPAEPAQEAARPDEAPMTARQKRAADRAAKRAADRETRQGVERDVRPGSEAPQAARPAVLGEPPVPIESAPARQTRQKAAKKGRRGQEEAPKPDAVKDEPKPVPTPEVARPEQARPEPKEEAGRPARPVDEPKPDAVRPEPRNEPARSEPVPEAPPLRADPVPAVTPAPEPRPAVVEPSTPAAPPAATPIPSPVAPAAEPAP